MKKVLCAAIVMSIFCVVSSAQVSSRSASTANGNAATAGDYPIGAGDVLWIDVWHEPDFEIKSIAVRPDGKITVRLLRDVQAAGLTPTQLGELIERGLKEKDYVTSAKVTVTVLEIRSQWVTILGNGVAKSIRYPLSGPLTVAELLAVAGGWANFAKTKEIKILRSGGSSFNFNFETFAQGKVEQNIPLRNGDIVVVP